MPVGLSSALIFRVIIHLLNVYVWILIARAIFSWIPLRPGNPLMRTVIPALYSLTEPVLMPVRNWLRPYQGNSPVDFSILVVFLAINVLQQLLMRIAFM